MKQYYETVDVAELPERDLAPYEDYSITVAGVYPDGSIDLLYYNYENGNWYNMKGTQDRIVATPVSWLRPVSLSDLIREVAGDDELLSQKDYRLQPISHTTKKMKKVFSMADMRKAWTAFYMRGFPHNNDSYGNETFEQYLKSLTKTASNEQ